MSLYFYTSGIDAITSIFSGEAEKIKLNLYTSLSENEEENLARGWIVLPVSAMVSHSVEEGQLAFFQCLFPRPAEDGKEIEVYSTVTLEGKTDDLVDVASEGCEVELTREEFLSVCVSAMTASQDELFSWNVYERVPEARNHSQMFATTIESSKVIIPTVLVDVPPQFLDSVRDEFRQREDKLEHGPIDIGSFRVNYGAMFMSCEFSQSIEKLIKEAREKAHMTDHSIGLISELVKRMVDNITGFFTWRDLITGGTMRRQMEAAQAEAQAEVGQASETSAEAEEPASTTSV